MWSNERADVIFVFGMGLDAVFGFAVGLVVVCNFLAQHGGAILGVVVALRVPLLCKHEMSLWIAWTSPQFIIVSGVSPRRYSEFSTSILQISVHFYLSGQHQSMSEIECQRLNVRDSMSETQCRRFDVRDGCTKLITCLCYTSHLGIQLDNGVQRDTRFVELSFRFLDCCKAFSECRLATGSIQVMSGLLEHGGLDFFSPVRNMGRQSPRDLSWCYKDGFSADMRLAAWIGG